MTCVCVPAAQHPQRCLSCRSHRLLHPFIFIELILRTNASCRFILHRLSATSISSLSTISLRARVSPSRSHDRPPSLLHSVFSLEDTFAFHRLWQNVRRNLRGNKERQPVRCIFAAMPRRTCAFAPALTRFAALNPQQLHLCRTSASGTTALNRQRPRHLMGSSAIHSPTARLTF